MPGLDDAIRRMRSGEPAVLVDEDRDGAAFLVAPAYGKTLASLQAMRIADASPPMLWLAADLAGGEDPMSEAATHGIGIGRVAPYGVLAKAAEPEAAVDAARLAGRPPAAWAMSLRQEGGILAGAGAASEWAARYGLALFTVQDVVAARLFAETIVEPVASARLPSRHADTPLEILAYRSRVDGVEHLALVHRPLGPAPLVRLHSECLTGDALGSLRCDCGDQLRESLRLIAEHPEGGVVVYLRGQEGRGIGLANKIRAYALQDRGLDTVDANLELGFPADLRSYGVAVQILRLLGVTGARLLTNNPAKSKSLDRYGIRIAEVVALRIDANAHNAGYLDTKRRKMGHDFTDPVAAVPPLPG